MAAEARAAEAARAVNDFGICIDKMWPRTSMDGFQRSLTDPLPNFKLR